jgi:hypothetical protein
LNFQIYKAIITEPKELIRIVKSESKMNRKKAAVVVIVVSILLGMVGVVWFMMGGNLNSQKIAVSNLRIDLGVQSDNVNYGTSSPTANYTVENLYNVDVTSVSLSIDGVKSGQDSLLILPGHSVSAYTVLSSAVSESTTYDIEFVFTFADGTSDTYSTSYTIP